MGWVSEWAKEQGAAGMSGKGGAAKGLTNVVKGNMPIIEPIIYIVIALVFIYMLYKVICDIGGWGWHR